MEVKVELSDEERTVISCVTKALDEYTYHEANRRVWHILDNIKDKLNPNPKKDAKYAGYNKAIAELKIKLEAAKPSIWPRG